MLDVPVGTRSRAHTTRKSNEFEGMDIVVGDTASKVVVAADLNDVAEAFAFIDGLRGSE
jgi:hypothetical protein